VITLDTSAIIAAINRRDADHAEIASILREEAAPRWIPMAILGEVGYMLESLGLHILQAFLDDLQTGAYTLDCGEDDVPRIGILLNRYHDLPLSFSDAAVIACAERHGGRVVTLDEHFSVVAREGTVRVTPAL
jgi:predicted nucleic acid-binding protein